MPLLATVSSKILSFNYWFFNRCPCYFTQAYASSAMPLLYFGSTVSSKALFLASDLLAIIGFLIVVLATIELGTSIGISPANRGLVRSGIYRYIKHPMYLGYAISEMGLVILNPLNLSICVVSMILYFIRSKIEIKILNS
jgi:protein-S-isoprenylcysteine O-methyltransferase Ste14